MISLREICNAKMCLLEEPRKDLSMWNKRVLFIEHKKIYLLLHSRKKKTLFHFKLTIKVQTFYIVLLQEFKGYFFHFWALLGFKFFKAELPSLR